MFFRAYVGKSYTDHNDIAEAQAVPGATVVAINGGVMVPISQVKIPDLPLGFITVALVSMIAIPSYLIWQLTH